MMNFHNQKTKRIVSVVIAVLLIAAMIVPMVAAELFR